ncbi:nitrate reductase molybdenum cofactor assembly chaperone [Paucibacter sp. M5-1]|uniref:nitrate reductase molybdenum cofactor assembly chaperone n=1 Tax=Paucibacter sp. M5-1 TaxID=3015998 RepID=UPI0022B9092B|nr:nitrate reductase molybdenum cofactor assembly chaperone [Paucibacter sp. M5-1]MCZ7885035.1 nitrate reductase molybdenum cofactor assembly chaperone [Paucibacter sp. M5-1]
MNNTPMSRSCRVLARLLDYPQAEMRSALPELHAVLRDEAALSAERLQELKALMSTLQQGDAYAVEGRYVDSFDRGRATSLHMFEHVHGDSRDRGPALVDLAQTYEAGGMFFDASELPDYLPVVLEFASTQPPATARAFLGEMAHILNTIHSGLIKHENPYAAAIGAVLELAGETPQAVQITADEALDEAWVEPPAFDGCSSKGQSRPGTPQPIHIVKKTTMNPGVRP